jgi:hypothetical protein
MILNQVPLLILALLLSLAIPLNPAQVNLKQLKSTQLNWTQVMVTLLLSLTFSTL